MSFFDNYGKSLIFVSLCSLLAWLLYWLPSSIERFYNVVFISVDYYSLGRFWIYVPAGIGMIARFIGSILGLLSLVLIWKGSKSLFDLKKWIVGALVLESVYFASLIPSGVWLNTGLFGAFEGGFTNIGISYLLQVIFTVPFLVVLAFKVKKYVKDSNFDSWKWIGFTFVGYVVALWSNSVLRWFDMVTADNLVMFFSGVSGIGALNAFVCMSLAVIFAVIGLFSFVYKKLGSAIRWVSLSLVMVGVHYVIYVVYSYFVNALNQIMLIDVWTIPFLGLGLVLLIKDKTA